LKSALGTALSYRWQCNPNDGMNEQPCHVDSQVPKVWTSPMTESSGSLRSGRADHPSADTEHRISVCPRRLCNNLRMA
jgi:hypothetical protein